MTEQEIVQILKDNKEKGIGYNFLPEEVQKWIYENFYKKILVYFDYQGKWTSIDETNLIDTSEYLNHIFSLTEDFELKKEPEGEWIEFDIRNDGFIIMSKNDTESFLWYEWETFLKYSEANDFHYTAFGGWLYDKSGDWVLSPQVGLIDDSGNAPFILNRYSHTYEKERITPVIPIKIRFWRK